MRPSDAFAKRWKAVIMEGSIVRIATVNSAFSQLNLKNRICIRTVTDSVQGWVTVNTILVEACECTGLRQETTRKRIMESCIVDVLHIHKIEDLAMRDRVVRNQYIQSAN